VQKLNEVVLLILGSGESGKSTIAKQFRIINNGNFSEEECLKYERYIHNNIITSIQTIIQGCHDFKFELDEETTREANAIMGLTNLFKLSQETAESIKKLLEHQSIKNTIEKSSEIQLIDSAVYFFESIDRIMSDDYIPSEQDVLRTRQPTTGIVETTLQLDYLQVKLVDVAGQQNQRRKWIHCFDNVQALIFCADISAYDMKLREDPKINRMDDALDLFRDTINSKWFINIDVILFLNKKDIFEDKLKKNKFKNMLS